jgi:hypothetical protein
VLIVVIINRDDANGMYFEPVNDAKMEKVCTDDP